MVPIAETEPVTGYNLVCPYCGYEDPDSWEVTGYEGVHDCPSCEREYWWEADLIYRTYKTKSKA